MFVSTLIILCLFNNALSFPRNADNARSSFFNFKEVIINEMKKIDDFENQCQPPLSYFYNGSCYGSLPPGIFDSSKVVASISFDEAVNGCNLTNGTSLWDIETIDEFDNVTAHIYNETKPNLYATIMLNFTIGIHLLNLSNYSYGRNISHGNSNNYNLTYMPVPDVLLENACLFFEMRKDGAQIRLKSDTRSTKTTHYICKKKINSCYNNTRCGKHGRCKNLIIKSECICDFMYTGKFCDQLSDRGYQSIIGGGLIGLGILYLIFQSTIKKIFIEKNAISIRTTTTTTTISRSLSIDQLFFRHSYSHYLWRIFIGLITILFATFCCHTIFESKIERLNEYQKLHNITIEDLSIGCQLFSKELSKFYKIPANYISLGILLILILSQLFFQNFPCRKKFWKHLSIPIIFNAHSHIYRFQSAAVFGIIALEIVNIFDEFIINAATYFIYGPLFDLFVQFGIGLLLGLRYCPILAIFEKENNFKNRLENIISYALGAMYLYCEIIFKIQSDIYCVSSKRNMSIINETLQKFNKLGINIKESIVDDLDTNRTAKLNDTYQKGRSWVQNKIGNLNLTSDDASDMENEFEGLNYSLELNKQSIFYNILRNAPYYYFIVYLAVCLTVLFINTFRHHFQDSSWKSFARWKYVKYNLLQTTKYIHSNEQTNYPRLFRCSNSLIYLFKKYVYSIRPYFRYSKLIICINISALTLVYYFTFWIQDHTYRITKNLLLFINSVLCALGDGSKNLCFNRGLSSTSINKEIRYISFLTASITCLQLFLGLKHYQTQMCKAYQGIYTDIPKLKYMSSVAIVSKSIRYPGRFMGSLVYSYGFLFIFVSIVYVIFRIIFWLPNVLDYGWKFFLPMIIFFLFQLLFIRLISKFLFVRNSRLLALRNLRLFHTFSYFNFFFDCFLGFIMCASRITKGICSILIFFSRLDYTPYGRGLEMWDASYASYVCFFHVEKTQRHPVVNIFTDMARKRLREIRRLRLKSTTDYSTTETLARFRWALAYTLINNEQLKRYRRHRLRTSTTGQSRTLGCLFGRMDFA